PDRLLRDEHDRERQCSDQKRDRRGRMFLEPAADLGFEVLGLGQRPLAHDPCIALYPEATPSCCRSVTCAAEYANSTRSRACSPTSFAPANAAGTSPHNIKPARSAVRDRLFAHVDKLSPPPARDSNRNADARACSRTESARVAIASSAFRAIGSS